jgi:hypothetical protein
MQFHPSGERDREKTPNREKNGEKQGNRGYLKGETE